MATEVYTALTCVEVTRSTDEGGGKGNAYELRRLCKVVVPYCGYDQLSRLLRLVEPEMCQSTVDPWGSTKEP